MRECVIVRVKNGPVHKINGSTTRRMDDFLLAGAKTNFDEYKSKWIVGASVKVTRKKAAFIGHFTAESYHSIAISLALIDHARLDCLVPARYRIQTINHPLPRQPQTVVMDKVINHQPPSSA